MGVDIYLESIWKPFEEKLTTERLTQSQLRPRTPSQIDAFMTHIYDQFRASGGYFRNAYNSGDVMWAMGKSWEMVGSMLDERQHLPIERARELVELIEAHPLTREQITAHVFGDMGNDHPTMGPIMRTVGEG
jgi:hypothetical protein